MEVLATSPARWRAEFNRQATEATMEAAVHYAQRLATQLAARTGRPDPMSAEDRVHAAIVGTLDERLRWEPERCDLAHHLMWAVKRDVFHELRRSARFPHVSTDDHRHGATEREVSDAIAVRRDGCEDVLRSSFAAWVSCMRAHAADDRAVLRLLDAYDAGAFDRHDVLATARMSPRMYHSALQRLKRIARKLPHEIQDAAIDAIAGGSR